MLIIKFSNHPPRGAIPTFKKIKNIVAYVLLKNNMVKHSKIENVS